MYVRLVAVLILIAAAPISALAQQDFEDDRFEGRVAGIVMDSETETPLGFARIDLYHESDSSLVMTALSRNDGSFELDTLRAGLYFLEVTYADYEPTTVHNIVIADARKEIDVGEIALHPEARSGKP